MRVRVLPRGRVDTQHDAARAGGQLAAVLSAGAARGHGGGAAAAAPAAARAGGCGGRRGQTHRHHQTRCRVEREERGDNITYPKPAALNPSSYALNP